MLQGETFGSVSVIVGDGIGVLVLDAWPDPFSIDVDSEEKGWNAAVVWAAERGAGFQDGEGDYPQLKSRAATEFYYLVGTPA